MTALIGAFAALVAGAVVGVETRRRVLLVVCKPAATMMLVALVGIPPVDGRRTLFLSGIVFSALGDAALLAESQRAFLAGTALFTVAHAFFGAAFLDGAPPSRTAVVAAAVFGALSIAFIRRMWRDVPGALRAPVVIYAAVITFMAASAVGTLDGGLPREAARLVAVGATSFFLSDALLAWRRFRGSFPHAQSVTLLLYWAGQLAIALGARGA